LSDDFLFTPVIAARGGSYLPNSREHCGFCEMRSLNLFRTPVPILANEGAFWIMWERFIPDTFGRQSLLNDLCPYPGGLMVFEVAILTLEYPSGVYLKTLMNRPGRGKNENSASN
jgi:hypothetical protein